MTTDNDVSIEAALERIETLVSKIEAGNISLDETIATFEEGLKLVGTCRTKLSAAENRIKILLKENGKTSLDDFENDSL